MERKPPLNSVLAARKFGSAGRTYPGVVVAVVTPTVLKTFPLLMAKLGWFSTLNTSTFARKYFPSVMWNSLPTERFTTRSEEHTSELQSRGHLVCRLLREKKKKN